MSSALEHSSHKHPLILRKDDVIARGALCYVCDRTIIGSTTYICTYRDIYEDCEYYYLHKSCAELPTSIDHYKHTKHKLALKPRYRCLCNVCGRSVKSLAYTCEACDIDVCVICSFETRVLHHDGHEHLLTLMPRNALFECDACGEKSPDASYVCTICDFWIHRKCAMAPFIAEPNYHRHSVYLIYSIPERRRNFDRFCGICRYRVYVSNWMYYCHRCIFFVHLGCALKYNAENTASGTDVAGSEKFPLPSEQSQFEHFSGNCCRIDFQSNGVKIESDIIKEHWSHKHPLEKFHFTSSSENDNEDNTDDRRVMICDGCIQPISEFHLSYYACIQCAFFLHSVCATKLPKELLGACTLHSEHLLFLRKIDRFYKFVKCGVCSFPTNGFYYHCESCDLRVDIRCAFLPKNIKHKSHKKHSLTKYPSHKSNRCSASNLLIRQGMQYACMTCTKFQIHILCALYPRRVKHKFDPHLITLRQPPFFSDGALHCEICEEQVDKESWLYHCDECDRGYHCHCVRQYENVKLGGTIKLKLNDENHTLALVLKRPLGKKSPVHICCYCKHEFKYEFLFECEGCGFLACRKCVEENLG